MHGIDSWDGLLICENDSWDYLINVKTVTIEAFKLDVKRHLRLLNVSKIRELEWWDKLDNVNWDQEITQGELTRIE